jgi:hypothetical protein
LLEQISEDGRAVAASVALLTVELVVMKQQHATTVVGTDAATATALQVSLADQATLFQGQLDSLRAELDSKTAALESHRAECQLHTTALAAAEFKLTEATYTTHATRDKETLTRESLVRATAETATVCIVAGIT